MEEQFEPQAVEPEAVGVEPQVVVEPQTFKTGLAFGVAAQQDLIVDRSIVMGSAAGRDLTASDSVMVSTVAGRDVSITDGVAVTAVVGNGLQVSDGGVGLAFASDVTVHHGTLGIVIASNVQVEEGSTVSMNVSPQQAAIFGLAFGAIFALLSFLLRRRR